MLHQFKKMARKAAFHDEIKIVLVVKEAVKLHNVGVIQIHLNFYFSDQRLFDVLFFNLCFRKGLQSTNESRRFMASHEDLSIFPLSHFLKQLELVYG